MSYLAQKPPNMAAEPMAQMLQKTHSFNILTLTPALGSWQQILTTFIFNHFLACTYAAGSETTLGKTLVSVACSSDALLRVPGAWLMTLLSW